MTIPVRRKSKLHFQNPNSIAEMIQSPSSTNIVIQSRSDNVSIEYDRNRINRNFAGQRGNQHKSSWSPEHDAALLRLVQENGGAGRWRLIAEKLENLTGYTGRVAKHCRERYFNHLDPNINRSEWTEEENEILAKAFALYGTAWSKIAKLLPGRTDNSIKNRWYSEARKISRKSGNKQPYRSNIRPSLSELTKIVHQEIRDTIKPKRVKIEHDNEEDDNLWLESMSDTSEQDNINWFTEVFAKDDFNEDAEVVILKHCLSSGSNRLVC